MKGIIVPGSKSNRLVTINKRYASLRGKNWLYCNNDMNQAGMLCIIKQNTETLLLGLRI